MNVNKKFKELMDLSCENEVVEWKTAKNKFDFNELGKYFSALSNEANLNNRESSWLIFGVDDKKKIIGTSYKKIKKIFMVLNME